MNQKETSATLWERYRDESRLQVQRRLSFFTDPILQPDPARQSSGSQSVYADFQSIGSLLVNSLANKLATALFPIGKSSFRIKLSDELQQQATDSGNDPDSLQTGLSKLEMAASKQLFVKDGLSVLTHVLKLLIVTGQCLIYRDPDTQRMSVWNSENFVTRRDPLGSLRTIVLKQCFKVHDLPEDKLDTLRRAKPAQYNDPKAEVHLYTRIEYNVDTKSWTVTEEAEGVPVSEEATYPEMLCPWLCPSWNTLAGSNYARGVVESFAGDFARLSMLSEALTTYELESLTVIHLVDEAAGGIVDEYMQADNGAFVAGKVGAITGYETGDSNKIQVIQAAIQEISQRLYAAFGYTGSGSVRTQERVTATEIQMIANESDRLLGGAYSTLAYTLQRPLLYLAMFEVGQDLLMGIISESIIPDIITGSAALGRSTDTQNMIEASQSASIVLPLVQAASNLDANKIVATIFRNNGVDMDTITKSAEQLQREADAQQRNAAMQQQAAQSMINPTDVVGAGQQLNTGM